MASSTTFRLSSYDASPERSSRRIGISVGRLNSPYFGEMVDGASEFLEQYGYTTLIRPSGFSRLEELSAWHSLREADCVGIIMHSISLQPEDLQDIMQAVPHSVVMNRLVEGHDQRSINVDNQRGSVLAARHLINHGHRKIAMICGPDEYQETASRTRGFLEELARHDMSIPDELMVDGRFSIEGGARAFRRLLQTERSFTAVFCQNDSIALGVMDVCRDERIAIPGELSVVGYDDINLASISTPRLTTVRHPLAELGAQAARLLLSAMDNNYQQLDNHPDQIVLDPELIKRDTVSDIRRGRNRNSPQSLTIRETECLQWIAAGKTSAEIAIILSISENTVNFHLKNIIHKLDARNRTHAVALALSQDHIHPVSV